MIKRHRVDLHVHSCLSPCADLLMSPKRIVEAATKKKLDMIALCDHNSAENVRAATNAARNTGLTILPGMEITSSEEVHVCAVFGQPDPVLRLQELVYRELVPGENDPELFGEQIVVNEHDEVEDYNRRLLIGATTMSIDRIVSEIHQLGGIVIASHVDRETYGIIGQLGFIPPDLEIDALEISAAVTYAEAAQRIPRLAEYPVISSSDAHNLEDIGRVMTFFDIERPDFSELRQALRNENGRSFSLRE